MQILRIEFSDEFRIRDEFVESVDDASNAG